MPPRVLVAAADHDQRAALPGIGPIEGDDHPVGDALMASTALAEALASLPPVEARIQVPTAIDRALQAVRDRDFSARVAQLEADFAHAGDKARAGIVAYELGELHERFLDDEAGAVKGFDRALRADPTLRPNLWAIRRLIFRRELWPKLVKLLDAEVRIARTDEERADLLVEKGHVLLDHLADRDGARDAFERAIAHDPECVGGLMARERLALQDGDSEALARVWRGLADAAHHPGRKVSYLLDLVRLYGHTGADAESLALARQVLVEAVALAPEAGASERVARERERLAELSGDPAEMLGALEARISNVREKYGPQGPPAAPATRRQTGAPLDRADELRLTIVALRRRQARIARAQGQHQPQALERAWGYLEQALALAGGEPLVLADFADLAERLGRFEELAELCRGWESLEGDPARSMSLSLRRAEALMRGGQREQAEALLSTLSSSAPGFLPITALRERDALATSDWVALAATYRESGDAARLGTTFGSSIEAVDPVGAAAHYVAAADLSSTYAGDAATGRAMFEKALEVAPGYPPAIEGLTALLERAGKLDETAALLELQSDAADPELRGYLLERLTQVYAALGRPMDVVGALRRLIELDPESISLRWRIEEVLGDVGHHADRVAILIEIAERTSDSSQRAAVLVDAARTCEHRLDDPSRAAGLYREALALVPEHRYARAASSAVLRRAGDWAAVVAQLRADADQLPDGPELGRVLREAAAHLRDRLDQPAEAIAVYRELLVRVPDDRAAMVELVDALQLHPEADPDGSTTVEVLEQLLDGAAEPSERMRLLLAQGRALERAGRVEDALYAYRRAADADGDPTHALISMAELAARARDISSECDALTRLAHSLGDPGRTDHRLAGELWEEVGWLWAIRLEDYDRAADGFARALAADPARRGAGLGAALVQAKRGELADVGEALAVLAGTMHGAYAASSLLLRAAAVAEVSGDTALARERVARAGATSPDDPGTLVVAAEYLPSAVIEALPANGAVEALMQRASIFGMRAAIASDPAARDDWELDQAEALAAAGQLGEALSLIVGVLRSRPTDLRGLQLLRRVCARGGDRAGLARASTALARTIGDIQGKLELLREAASIFDAELGEATAAVPLYRRILAVEPGAPELDRLLTIYREHRDVRGLVESISDRLNWLDQQAEAGPEARAPAVPLLLERAQLRAGIGDKRGAIRDLVALLEIDPQSGPGLSQLATLRAEDGEAAEAADLLKRYLEVERDPERRAEAELTLSQILAEDMQDLAGAVTQLARVVAASPEDLELRERLIGLLLRVNDWQRAVREIREVEKRRGSNSERARDELRVAALLRDKVADSSQAKQALERARQLDPLNIDAVRELAELVGDKEKRQVLAHAASDSRHAIGSDPARPELYERLSVVARWLGDADARYFAVSALGALSTLSSEQKDVVGQRRAALAKAVPSSTPIPAADWSARFGVHGSGGVGAELWVVLAEAASKLVGLDASRLGFGRAERQSVKTLARDYPLLAAVVSCFAADAAEIYVADGKSGYARVVSGSRPAVFLGADVARGETPVARFLLGRAVALAREGTGTVAEMRSDELVMLLAAAARLTGVSPLPPALDVDSSAVDEYARSLQKHLARRDRKSLPLLAGRFGELGDPLVWRRATLARAACAGLLVCGDLDAALDGLDVGRGARSVTDEPIALDLLSWSVSEDHLALRTQLGLSKAT